MFQLAGLGLNFVLFLISVLAFVIYYFKSTQEHWRRQGVPCFLSPFEDLVFERRKNKSLAIQERYRRLAPHACGGVWFAAKPYLIVRDPKLVQTILIKSFSHFTDRGLVMLEDVDPLSAHIFNLSGARWKNIRTKLVHSFSGLKLKSTYPLMEECTKILDRYLEEKLKDSPKMEVRDLMMRFATDVIGMCSFSFDCQTISDAKSVFRQVGQKFTPDWVHMAVRETITALCPRFVSWLNWTNFDPDLLDFFSRVTKDTVKARKENPSQRKDFMQILVNAQQEEQKQNAQNDVSEHFFTENIMVGQVFLFFVAGFQSPSIALAYCLYELALNPDVMERLHNEVTQVMEAHSGEINYDALKEMQYLECCVLDRWPRYYAVR